MPLNFHLECMARSKPELYLPNPSLNCMNKQESKPLSKNKHHPTRRQAWNQKVIHHHSQRLQQQRSKEQQHISTRAMACFGDEELRAQRRSFMSSNGCSFSSIDDDDEDLVFEKVQNYVAPLQPAWFESSRASSRRNLEHKLCERDATIAELHRVGIHDDRIFAPSTLLEDRARFLPYAPSRVPAPTRRRPHRAHRCIVESAVSLATMPTIVESSG